MRALAGALTLALLCAAATAAFELFEFDTPEQERRYKELAAELRCLVCQNQSLADSNAELAADLRRVVHGMILAGASDREIVDFLLERYGDFVLYRPPLRESTLLLWLGPFAALAAGAFVLFRLARKNRAG